MIWYRACINKYESFILLSLQQINENTALSFVELGNSSRFPLSALKIRQQQQQQSLVLLVGYMNHTAKDQLADIFTKFGPSIKYIFDKLNA